MTDKLTIRAIYEDGVFKPLQSINLKNKQEVSMEIEIPSSEANIVRLGGTLAPYWEGDSLSYEEIEALLNEEKQKSFERLMRQIDGDFKEDGDSSEQ